jgi:colanic acid/amylovoran biosynthesis glycosyltransferase
MLSELNVRPLDAPSATRPVVACYCATFLKPEMLHIYRQLTALEKFQPVVIAQKREEPQRFPFDRISVVGKPWTHFARRIWWKQIRDAPWQISRGELEQLLRVLSTTRAQLLHIYFGHIAVHLIPLIEKWANPTVVSFHGADVMVDLQKPRYRSATRKMLGAVRLVLVRSESLRRAVIDLGCDASKIRIHRTGIPLSEFPFRPRVFPTDGAWRFLQACRLIEKKGLGTSLRAFNEFVREQPNAHFTISGDGPLREELEEFCREFQLEKQVSFTGFISQRELRELYYASHIFLHPSELGGDGNQEGVPNSMLEAMASGLPVFASNHGGIPEAIDNGTSGVLVRERDHDALARALRDWTSEPEKLAALARNGAESVARNFELGEQVRQLEQFYAEAIA